MDEVMRICGVIKEKYDPEQIIIFGKKVDMDNNIKDIDICVVVNCKNKKELQREIYLTVESHIPFDVFLYTPQERDRLRLDEASFMSRILSRGTVVYEKG